MQALHTYIELYYDLQKTETQPARNFLKVIFLSKTQEHAADNVKFLPK